MKFLLSSILALAIAGVPVRVQEPDDKSKPQEEPKKKPPEPRAKPQQPQPEEKPKPKPDKPPKQEPQQPEEKQREKQQKEQDKQQKEQSKTDRKNRPQEQTETARPGKGQRIPPEKFRSSFGREHHFRVARSGGDDRRFRYGGYWFEVVEVWPAGWAFDDDCYIEEDGDDYYLVDIIHPEMRVLVIVVSG